MAAWRWQALVMSMMVAGTCHAQAAWPDRPITTVVPFPAGGAIDVATRVLLQEISGPLGQSIVTQNRPGASGNIGTSQVVRSAADGYTLLLGAAPNTAISPYMYKDLGYDVAKDLAPIAQFGDAVNVIYVNAGFPAQDLASLIQAARTAEKPLAYASPGSGTTVHLAMELVRSGNQLEMLHVPFKGSPAAVAAVAAGEVPIGVDALGPVLPMIQAGKVRPLAVSGSQRYAGLPDVPTFAQAGVKTLVPASYLGLFAPAGTPEPVIRQVADAMRDALKKPAVVERLEQLGYLAAYRDTADFAQRVEAERPVWKNAVEISGATVD
ncbi:tripartite tricarboxylate transporter substrate binding protein [Achromobacter sp. GG226]|uniref:Bug family tripartite tricarboxylate transporter substrate binding protein n=1 Tax=Verticiella alkaliphila TaxID=2779529 RepID=UPI001C0C90D3|nr:tripartite tricarboxylate transporter substrate binding protein [Verticiella sp. GG226]MBU4609559.1 tripartite tricarboxylate transporter substrate binding protein [Verticiella sp. GG226]